MPYEKLATAAAAAAAASAVDKVQVFCLCFVAVCRQENYSSN